MGSKGSGSRERYLEHVRAAAEEHELPFYVLDALIQKESEYNPRARSKKGAVGLTQLMPKTAKGLKVNPHIPEENISGGARYLSDMLKRFGNMEKALVAYNAGPSRVTKPPRMARNYAKNVLTLARSLEPWQPPLVEEIPLSKTLRGFVK